MDTRPSGEMATAANEGTTDGRRGQECWTTGLADGKAVRDYVKHWAEHCSRTGSRVVSAAGDSRRPDQGHPRRARSSRRVRVSPSRSTRHAPESAPSSRDLPRRTRRLQQLAPTGNRPMASGMRGASKTITRHPLSHGRRGSPLGRSPPVSRSPTTAPSASHMSRVGARYVDLIINLAEEPLRARRARDRRPGPGRAPPDDKRCFVTAAERNHPALRLVPWRWQRAARQDRPAWQAPMTAGAQSSCPSSSCCSASGQGDRQRNTTSAAASPERLGQTNLAMTLARMLSVTATVLLLRR